MNEAADNDVSDVGGMDSTAALSIRHTNSLKVHCSLRPSVWELGVGGRGGMSPPQTVLIPTYMYSQ